MVMKLKDVKSTHQLFECCVCGSQEASKLFSQCLHTVCNNCVRKVALSNRYMCNKCSKGSDQLITNAALCKMNSQSKTPNCIWCAEGGEANVSQGHCKQCDQWLCAECIKGHNRMPPFRSHTINIVGDCGDKGLKCETHPRESLELFCETCGVLTCRDCQLSVHRDHGGHRWVKEKAELLRPGLLFAMRSLETEAQLLKTLMGLAKQAPTALLSSVDAAKLAQHNFLDGLLQTIHESKESLDSEIDKVAESHIDKLNKAFEIMGNLMERIDYTLRLSQCLVDNEGKDPASLVQLAACLEDRIGHLAKQVRIVAADEGSDKEKPAIWDNEGESQTVSGWRESAASRIIFLPNRSCEEFTQLVSSICWTGDQDAAGLTLKLHPNNKGANEGNNTCNAAGVNTNQTTMDFTHHTSGCAVCRSSGLLTVCQSCQRAFHLHCHLPRLTSTAMGSHHWICSLCSAARVKPNSTSPHRIRDFSPVDAFTTNWQPSIWTHEQFKSGCLILLNLLCHPEAFCFTASTRCPICSSSLTVDDASTMTAEGLCSVFHGLVHSRWCLENSETLPVRPIEIWIRDIDCFIADTFSKSKEFGAPDAAEVFDRAASILRDTLDSCVESYYPAFFEA